MSACRATSARPASRMSCAASADVQVVLLAQDQHAEEFAPVLGADDRGVERHAGRLQVARRQRPRRDGDHADALARRQRRLHPGHLDQRAGRHRHADMRRQFALEQRQEAAVGGDRLGALRHQVRGGGEEVGQQPGGAVQHHAFRGGAAHHAIQHRERPGAWRCPCRRECAGSAPPASGCRAARRRWLCRPSRCRAPCLAGLSCPTLPETAARRESGRDRNERRRRHGRPARSPRLTSTCWPSGTRRPSATGWRSPTRSAAASATPSSRWSASTPRPSRSSAWRASA